MKRRKLILLIIIAAVMVAGVFSLLFFVVMPSEKDDLGPTPPPIDEKPVVDIPVDKTEKIKVVAMGDMLPHDSVVQNAKTTSGYDFETYFQNIRPVYEDADVVFCNQEGLSSGPDYKLSGYPAFNAPLEFADGLKNGAGCNLISLANNHIGDKSTAAINATLDKWSTLSALAVAGANRNKDDQKKVSYFEIKGVKFAFLAFADFNNNKNTPAYAVNIYHDEALFGEMLSTARANADVVLVSMHWGTEDSSTINNDQKAQVEKLRKAGVDVVIGTGPHILQKTEWVERDDGEKMLVWYSIGNMLSSQLTKNELTSCIVGFNVVKNTTGKITIEEPTCTPTLMSYSWTASEKKNEDLLKRKDLKLKLLKDSDDDIKRLMFSDTVEARMNYIRSTLSDTVKVIE